MMEQKDKHPMKCETCSHFEISGSNDSCPNEEICGKNGCTISPAIKSWVEIHGCASHPLALQVLAGPVIAELEREIKDQRELQSHHRGSHSEVHRKMRDALEYAIQLLKGDVNIDPEIYICHNCDMFGCPIFMKDPKVTGCKYGPDIMRQIKASKKSKSRDFEEICEELGI